MRRGLVESGLPPGLTTGLLALAVPGGVVLVHATRAQTALLATSAVGRAPSAIAMDPRSGHVFVANSGTTR
jgi:hypothetical protein